MAEDFYKKEGSYYLTSGKKISNPTELQGYAKSGGVEIKPGMDNKLQSLANTNPEQADNIMDSFGYNKTPQANVPKGAVAISGAEFNTAEKQKAGFTNIQPVGNTLYGIPKAPIVPDVLPQKDFAGATTPQVLSEGSEKAKGMVSFTDQQKIDLDKANQRLVAGTGSDTDKNNVDYAKGKGWQPTTTEEKPVVTPVKSTADTLFEKYSDINTVRENAKKEAMKTAGLDEKSTAIATAQSVVNKYRTDLQNQGILDIKEQDIRRAQPILTSQIAANLNELSREQKLDTMILQNNYNNALVEQEIAQGNYDRAREIVKETADDAYNTAKDQIEALKFKNEMEEKTADKMTKELEYERELAKDGYVLIRSTDGLKGLTEDKIYRDPVSGKIYMKPAPKIAQIIDVNGRKIGLDEMGNKIRDFGSSVKDISPSDQVDLLNAGYTVGDDGKLVKSGSVEAGIVTTATGDAYDIKSYATDPTHETKIQSILNGIGQFKSIQDIDSYIKSKYPNSPVTGQMIANSAGKYGVSWEMMTAIMAQDSSMGTAGKAVRTKNPGNVGNTDSGGTQSFKSWQDGVDAVAKNLEWRKTTTTPKTTLSERAKLVQQNPALLSNYTNTEKGKIIDELAKSGADTTPLEITALGNTAIKDISQSKDALDGLLDLSAKINDNLEYIGPIKGLAALNPWSKARKIQSDVDRIRQTVGKALEGGVLRKEDEEKYKKILATVTDTPSTAQYKITQLISDIKSNIVNYGKGFGLSEEYVNSKLLNSNLYEQNLLSSNNIGKSASGVTSSGIGYTVE